MDLVDIKRTDADKKAEEKRWEEPSEREDYPYGLSIHIDEEAMAKLGLSEKDFDTGQPVKVMAEGFISNDSITRTGGKSRRSMSIQFTKLCVDQESEGTSISEAMYGDK